MSWLAPRRYALLQAWRTAGRQPSVLLLAILLTGTALALPLLMATLAWPVWPLARDLQRAPQVTVFAALGTSSADLQQLQARLSEYPGVREVRHVPRDEALAELAQRHGLTSSLADLRSNPLPDALIVTWQRGAAPDTLDAGAREFRGWPRVDAVQYEAEWYRKLNNALRVMLLVGGVVVGGALLTLVFILLAAVRLMVHGDLEELRLLKLVGATRGFQVRPYVYLGAATLALGALIAIGAVAAALVWLAPALAELSALYGLDIQWRLPPTATLVGLVAGAALLGAVTAGWAVWGRLRSVTP